MNVPQTEDEDFALTSPEDGTGNTVLSESGRKASGRGTCRGLRRTRGAEEPERRGTLWIGLCLGCLVGFYAAAIVAARAGGKVMGCGGILQ